MGRSQYAAPAAVDGSTRYGRNENNAGQPLDLKYHYTATALWSANPATRRLCPTADIRSHRTERQSHPGILVFKRPCEEPSLIEILHDMAVVHQKLALAEQICNAT